MGSRDCRGTQRGSRQRHGNSTKTGKPNNVAQTRQGKMGTGVPMMLVKMESSQLIHGLF